LCGGGGGATRRETERDRERERDPTVMRGVSEKRRAERRGAKKRTAAIRKVKLGPSPTRRISGVAPSQIPVNQSYY
jgi:hypothetical protein